MPYRVSKKVTYKRKTKKATKSKVASNSARITNLAKTMNQGIERKIKGLEAIYLGKPKNQQSGSVGPLYFYNACLGNPPSTWEGPNGQQSFQGLDGFQWKQGTGPNERIGRYLYLKHTNMNLRLNMLATPQKSGPTQFRVIVFKSKRLTGETSEIIGNPNSDLFIDNQGNSIGINVSSIEESRSFEFMNMLINKRNYTCVMDKKVVLQPSLISVQGGSNVVSTLSTNYPPEVNFSMKLKHESKTAFTNFDQPLDLNYQYCVQVISAPYGSATGVADDWRISLRGTVSCIDS